MVTKGTHTICGSPSLIQAPPSASPLRAHLVNLSDVSQLLVTLLLLMLPDPPLY